MRVKVEVKQDHLQRLVNTRSQIASLAELVWNALDGDATEVDVSFGIDQFDVINEIRIKDNGTGIDFSQAKSTFGSLGASWKSTAHRSTSGRMLHGRAGEGRFSAFSLGHRVEWNSVAEVAGAKQRIRITGAVHELGSFDISDPVDADGEPIGTEVTISNIEKPPTRLARDAAVEKFTERFALYLLSYSNVRVTYAGRILDPKALMLRKSDYELPAVTLQGGEAESPRLTVIEWGYRVERELHLCDTNGFSLAETQPGIHAPGFDFTAFLYSERFRIWHKDGLLLEPGGLNPDANALVDAAKDKLRQHFRERAAEQTVDVVKQWKTEQIYPFTGEPQTPIEQAERQVFDIVALNVNDYLPDFTEASQQSKKFSLQMLKTAIERSPEDAKRIIGEVLQLPLDKQEELAALLDRTSMAAIVNAAKSVADRLEFMSGLDAIIFKAELKRKVKERKQLHRLLAENTWLFGEEFNLTVDDQSLDEVLRQHLKHLGKERTELAPVTTIEGESGIVDLMLSRRVPQSRQEEREHLIVELKRPSAKLNADAATQIEKYAFAVAKDERFRDVNTKWTFWLVSNDLDGHLQEKITNQANQPNGMLLQKQNITIWVKTWGQIIDAAKGRLQFFAERLEYKATHDSGLEYLQKTHAKYLPEEALTVRENTKVDQSQPAVELEE